MSTKTTPSATPADASAAADMTAMLQHAKDSLARMQPKLPANFRFRWREFHCLGRVDRKGDTTRLRVVCDLGPLPFSAENARLRERLNALVRWSKPADDCRFVISPQQRLMLVAEHTMTEPYAGEDALAQAIAIMARARPLLEIVTEQHRDAVA